MKVKVKTSFRDKYTDELYKVGDVIEVTEERFDEILSVLKCHPEIETYELAREPILSLPGLEIYPSQRKVFRDRQEIQLTTKEYEILLLLVTHAECSQEIFTTKAMDEIHKASAGIPRMVNRVCEKSLMYAFQQQKRLIDDYMIKYVVEHEMLGTVTGCLVYNKNTQNCRGDSPKLQREIPQ